MKNIDKIVESIFDTGKIVSEQEEIVDSVIDLSFPLSFKSKVEKINIKQTLVRTIESNRKLILISSFSSGFGGKTHIAILLNKFIEGGFINKNLTNFNVGSQIKSKLKTLLGENTFNLGDYQRMRDDFFKEVKNARFEFENKNYEKSIVYNLKAKNIFEKLPVLLKDTLQQYYDKVIYFISMTEKEIKRKEYIDRDKEIAKLVSDNPVVKKIVNGRIIDVTDEEMESLSGNLSNGDEEKVKNSTYKYFIESLKENLEKDETYKYGKWELSGEKQDGKYVGRRIIDKDSDFLEVKLNSEEMGFNEVLFDLSEFDFAVRSKEYFKYERSFCECGDDFECSSLGDKSVIIKTANKVMIEKLLSNDIVEDIVDELYNTIFNGGETKIDKFDIVSNPKKQVILNGYNIAPNTKIEVKKTDKLDYHLSEFFGVFKTKVNINQYPHLIQRYNSVIESLVGKLNENDGGIISSLDSMGGIFLDNYMYYPKDSYELKWSTEGVGRKGDHRLTIRFTIKGEGYKWDKPECENIPKENSDFVSEYVNNFLHL